MPRVGGAFGLRERQNGVGGVPKITSEHYNGITYFRSEMRNEQKINIKQ